MEDKLFLHNSSVRPIFMMLGLLYIKLKKKSIGAQKINIVYKIYKILFHFLKEYHIIITLQLGHPANGVQKGYQEYGISG